MQNTARIPTYNLDNTQSAFLIRPILRTVDPEALKETLHRHNYQELLWIKSGHGKQLIDDKAFAIQPLTFYLIPRGQLHYFLEGDALDGFLIRFTDAFLQDSVSSLSWNYRQTLFSHFTIHRSLTITASELRYFEGILMRMWQEQQNRSFGYEMLQRHLLSILLIQLERARQKIADEKAFLSQESLLYKEFLDLLEAYFKHEHSVTYYASQMGISPRKLTQVSASHAGKTAKTLIQDRIILEAQRLLQHTNLSVKEISYRLGFRDPAYFSKAFKAVAGVAPQAYEANL